MYRVICKQCGASVVTDDPAAGSGDVLACRCCPESHSHGENANACPGAGLNHAKAPCPEPDGGAGCVARTPEGEPCPGEHCGTGVKGCQVCRPVFVQWLGLTPIGA